MTTRICAIRGCRVSVFASGWCPKHYMRWYHHGDPQKTVRRAPATHRYDGALCVVEDCTSRAYARRWCRLHYRRWQRLGSPTAPPKRRPNGSFYRGTEYMVGKRGGRMVLAHRVIMEEHIGRPLTSDEHVHHVNGDKRDNRLANLRLLTKSKHMALHGRGHRGTATESGIGALP